MFYRCECGRFARFVSAGIIFNGSYTCYSYDVKCKKCGTITVECV